MDALAKAPPDTRPAAEGVKKTAARGKEKGVHDSTL